MSKDKVPKILKKLCEICMANEFSFLVFEELLDDTRLKPLREISTKSLTRTLNKTASNLLKNQKRYKIQVTKLEVNHFKSKLSRTIARSAVHYYMFTTNYRVDVNKFRNLVLIPLGDYYVEKRSINELLTRFKDALDWDR